MSETTQLSSRERVFAACDQLAEAEERITVAAVRRVAQVSMQDASDGVRAWRESRAQVQSVPEPPEVVGRALRGVWGTALSAAREEVEHVAAEARAGREQAEARVAELTTTVVEREAARDQAQRESQRMKADLGAARQDAQAARGEATAAVRDLAQEQGRREHAEGEAIRLRGELAGAQERIRSLEAEAQQQEPKTGR